MTLTRFLLIGLPALLAACALVTGFEQALGKPSGALLGIGIMMDTDNTETSTVA